MQPASGPTPRSATRLWLSHHHDDQLDRCAVVGGHHVCRRCVWFWPATLGVVALALVGLRWPEAADPVTLFLLPIPVMIEWWAEQLGLVRYAPRRSVGLSLIAAPAVGVGLARYLQTPGDPLFWTVVTVYAVVCAVPVALRWRRISR
ncbi:MAG: hypothetical protein ACKO5A_06820 [Actinomycetota bacterium]